MTEPSAQERLYTALAFIPAGKLITYGQLAALIGMPKRARWVGQQLGQLPRDTPLPWHRVINAQGKSSFPVNSTHYLLQHQLLKQEGIVANNRGCFDLSTYGCF